MMMNDLKKKNGERAREVWRKILKEEPMALESFNYSCGNKFKKCADLTLDNSEKRQTAIRAEPIENESWKRNSESIYVFVKNGKIMKIGGTRTGMRNRWGSYLCGHCVPQRIAKKTGEPFPGKMSVTNAHLYHTIEQGLIDGEIWEIYNWELPTVKVMVEILGSQVEVIAQTYHAYESLCIKKFYELTGHIPQLCDNSDPNYKN